MISRNSPFYEAFTHGIGTELARFFREQLQAGKSDFKARDLTIERLDYTHKRRIPPLPPGEYLRVHDQITNAKPPFEIAETKIASASDVEDPTINWLAEKLRQDPKAANTSKLKYRTECIKTFGISGRDYQHRVWPGAREKLGWERKAKGGRKSN